MTTTITNNRRRLVAGLATAMLVSAPAAHAVDLRSPDARDAGAPAQRPAQLRIDLRSPDARDAALPPVAAVAQVAPAPAASRSGLSWGYAVLMLALAVAAGMGLNEALRRRRLSRLLARRA